MKSSIISLVILPALLSTISYPFSVSDMNSLVFQAASSHQLNEQEWKSLAQASLFKDQYRREGSQLKAASGYKLYKGRHASGTVFISLVQMEAGKKLPEKINLAISPNFSIVTESPTLMVYCSCGSNLIQQTGDNCHAYNTSQGLRCGGNCTGNQSGKSCSFTGFRIQTGEVFQI